MGFFKSQPTELVKTKKVTEPSEKDAYFCLSSMIGIASADSKGFTCAGTLPATDKRVFFRRKFSKIFFGDF